jgi:environmental stress-induced protein Ves
VLRGADAPRVRWRNDGGWTREIVRVPTPLADRDGDAFDWRVSIAEVETDGPFSMFAGCDRVLVLLAGAGMDLRLSTTGETIHLRADSRIARFAGEVPIDATLVAGPTTDFNLIWRRDAFDVTVVECERGAARVVGGGAGEVVVAHVVHGTLALARGPGAAAGDTVVGDPGETLRLRVTGVVVVFVVTPTPSLRNR